MKPCPGAVKFVKVITKFGYTDYINVAMICYIEFDGNTAKIHFDPALFGAGIYEITDPASIKRLEYLI